MRIFEFGKTKHRKHDTTRSRTNEKHKNTLANALKISRRIFCVFIFRRISVSVVLIGDRCRRIFFLLCFIVNKPLRSAEGKKIWLGRNKNGAVLSQYTQFARNYDMECYQFYSGLGSRENCVAVLVRSGSFVQRNVYIYVWYMFLCRLCFAFVAALIVYLISISQVDGFRIPRKGNKRCEFMSCETA